MGIEIIKYKPLNKGSLKAIVDIYVSGYGLEIFGCTYFSKGNNQRWVSLPTKEIVKDNEKKYLNIIRFRDKETSDRFQRGILEAIDLHEAKSI